MTYSLSVAPDITESIPYLLAARSKSEAVASGGCRFAVTIAGVGFNLAPVGGSAYSTRPAYSRESVPITKQQVDTSKEAGEQTLSNFWLRSQASWHKGAGVRFYEPSADADTEYRFETSQGVDVWTPGRVSLLDDVASIGTVGLDGNGSVASYVLGGVDGLLLNAGGVLKKVTSPTSSTPITAVTGHAPVGPVAIAGQKFLYGGTFGIDVGDLSGTTATPLHTSSTGVRVTPYWVKSRIIAVRGNELHQLTLTGTALDTTPGTGTLLYAHPDPTWTWTNVTEGPSSILVGGRGGGYGAIYRFSLQDSTSSSGTPTLGQAYQVAELPPGEGVYSVKVYLGRYIAIGTTHGVRIGVLDSQDGVQHGPLTVTTAAPVKALAARDSFIYAAAPNSLPDGSSGLARISLDANIGNTLTFPWAWDASAKATGDVTSVAALGSSDQMAFCVAGANAVLQNGTPVPSGYITSGRVRYSTIEPKAFHSADIRADFTGGGNVGLAVGPAEGDFVNIGTFDSSTGAPQDVGLGSDLIQEYVRYKVTITGGTILSSVQLKALPAPRRQRLITFPLSCFDREEDPNGQRYGSDGYAWTRVAALEEAQDQRIVVTVTDSRTKESFPALIEDLQFLGHEAPNKGEQNFGGFLAVQVRSV